MPVQYLKGVGPAKAKIFEKLGVKTTGDLLEYFPRDWIFIDKPVKISELLADHNMTISGLIESTDLQGFKRPARFEAVLTDDTGKCRIIWFHGGYLQKQLEPGQTIMACGKVTKYKDRLQMVNPVFYILDEDDTKPGKTFGGGVYRASANLSSRQIKKVITQLTGNCDELVDELYTKKFLDETGLIPRAKAFLWIHQPENKDQLARAKKRLKYDELFLMQTGLALRRYRLKNFSSAGAMACTDKIDSRIRKRFPFLLTEDQNTVIEQIVNDMAGTCPMNRLLQGDVGSGKTVVALYAALLAIANGYQAAIMAPTEVLAGQHFLSIERFLGTSKVKRMLITGGMTGVKRREALDSITEGEINIVVGTVALLQKDIKFANLGLVVIDEQHKFGVEQRADIRKQSTPHCLVMTATPIPRTLAMTAFGDLDVSLIQNCPPGRGSVVTKWVSPDDRSQAEEFIQKRLKASKQAYFVYPRIENLEDDSDIRSASEEYERLKRTVFDQFNVELLHGRMTGNEKRRIMQKFRSGKIDVLVSTVVIEVGLDVPNATIMVIENADRFGLAQLHQLRGRIGRGQSKSFCFLFADTQNDIAISRLETMTRTTDGFEIAEEDLKIRGPGELFSTRQHGLPDLKIADIIEDYELLAMARRYAGEFVKDDPMLIKTENKNLRRALLDKFGDSLGLADVA